MQNGQTTKSTALAEAMQLILKYVGKNGDDKDKTLYSAYNRIHDAMVGEMFDAPAKPKRGRKPKAVPAAAEPQDQPLPFEADSGGVG